VGGEIIVHHTSAAAPELEMCLVETRRGDDCFVLSLPLTNGLTTGDADHGYVTRLAYDLRFELWGLFPKYDTAYPDRVVSNWRRGWARARLWHPEGYRLEVRSTGVVRCDPPSRHLVESKRRQTLTPAVGWDFELRAD
jgi:hypothetical protein